MGWQWSSKQGQTFTTGVSGQDLQGRSRTCWNLEWALGFHSSLFPPTLGDGDKFPRRGERVFS